MRKALQLITKIILLAIVGLVIWYNLPQTREDQFSFLPDNALGYGQVKIDWTEKGPQELFNIFWKKIAAANPRFDNSLAKSLVFSWLPRDAAFAVIYDQQYLKSKKDPELVAVIRLGKRTKLLQLARLWLSGPDTWQIENDLVVIRGQAEKFSPLKPEKLITIKNILLPTGKTNLEIYLPNREQQLTSLVKSIEAKNSFALFPSITAVAYLQVTGKLVDAGKFQGKITFVGKNISDVDKIGLDAIFLNNLLLRYLYGYGFDYSGEVGSLANYVEINYRLDNLGKVWERFK